MRFFLLIFGAISFFLAAFFTLVRHNSQKSAPFILFTSYEQGTNIIYRMRFDGTGKRRISPPGLYSASPVWSPDGRWILFEAYEGDGINLYRMTAGGAELQGLTADDANEFSPVWSPDGKWIAFAATRDGNVEVYRMRSDGAEIRNLTSHPKTDFPPTWSPDGKYLLFQSDRSGNLQLYLLNVGTMNLDQITHNANGVYDAAWSPDGEWIAFSDYEKIYRMRPSGADLQTLVEKSYYAAAPSWSPDGEWLLFMAEDGIHYNAFLMRPDGADIQTLLPSDHWFAASKAAFAKRQIGPYSLIQTPDWSPDGEWIVFTSEVKAGIFKIRPDGTGLTQLTDGFYDKYPVWSPPMELMWRRWVSWCAGCLALFVFARRAGH